MNPNDHLIPFWQHVVVGPDVDIARHEPLLALSTTEWMYRTLLEGARAALEELGYLDGPLEGTEPERALAAYSRLSDIKRKAPKKTSRVFHSWPRIIRESREFNCVGASLLLLQILSSSRLPSKLGILPFHLVNLVPLLEKDDLLYLDATNGIGEKVEARRVGEVHGMDIVAFARQIDFFNQAVLGPCKSIVLFVLENLALVPKLAKDPHFSIKGEPREKEEAKAIYGKHADIFETLCLDTVADHLFPWRKALESHPLITQDKAVTDSLMAQARVSMISHSNLPLDV